MKRFPGWLRWFFWVGPLYLGLLSHCGPVPINNEPSEQTDFQRWPDRARMETWDGSGIDLSNTPDEYGLPPAREDYGAGKLLSSQGSEMTARAIIAFPNGKVAIAGRVDAGTNNSFSVARFFPDGSFDTTFASSGKVVTDFGTGRGEVAHALATDSNGKLIAAGRYNFGTEPNNYYVFAVARYNTNGSLDTNFATNGWVVTNINSLNAVARAVAIQTDNKVVVAGYAATILDTVGPNGQAPPYYHQNYDAVVARYLTNGILDTSFNAKGFVIQSFSKSSDFVDFAYDVKIGKTSGKIVIGGGTWGNGTLNTLLARYNTNGSLDTAFGGTGITSFDLAGGNRTDLVNQLAMQDDERILGAGYAHDGTSHNFLTFRITSAGILDTSFNKAGSHALDFSSARGDFATAITIQGDGQILVGGRHFNSQNYDFALARYATNGVLDTVFMGTNGRSVNSIGAGEDSLFGIAEVRGAIYAAGRVMMGSYYQAAVVRYNIDGSVATSGTVDKSFNTTGSALTSAQTAADRLDGVVLTTDEKVVGFGRSNAGNNNWAVVRYTTGGQLDTTFGTTVPGMTILNSGNNEILFNGVIDSLGRVVAVGRRVNDFGIMRLTTRGVLDTSFNQTGIHILNGGGTDIWQAAALQTDGKIVVVGSGGAVPHVHVARYNTNGSLDTGAWGTGNLGYVLTSTSTTDDEAFAVSIQADGKAVVAGWTNVGTKNSVLVMRYLTDGRLDSVNWGTGGKTIISASTGADEVYAIDIQQDGKVVLGGFATNANVDHLAIRLTTRGTLDSSFNSDGMAQAANTANLDDGRGILVMPNGKIVLTGEANNQVGVARWLTDGTLDTTFGGDGTVRIDISGGADDDFGLVVMSDGRIITVGRSTPDTQDFGVTRIWP